MNIIFYICSGNSSTQLINFYFMDGLNVYQVIKNGNELVFQNANKKSALRRALSLSSDRLTYVELWYVHGDGSRVLVNFWN